MWRHSRKGGRIPRKSLGTAGEGPSRLEVVTEEAGEKADARAVQLCSPSPCKEEDSSPEVAVGVWEVGMLQPAPSMTAEVCSRRCNPLSSSSGHHACLALPSPHLVVFHSRLKERIFFFLQAEVQTFGDTRKEKHF